MSNSNLVIAIKWNLLVLDAMLFAVYKSKNTYCLSSRKALLMRKIAYANILNYTLSTEMVYLWQLTLFRNGEKRTWFIQFRFHCYSGFLFVLNIGNDCYHGRG